MRKKALVLVSTIILALGLVACKDDDVGFPCTMEGLGENGEGSGSGNEINAQALDCATRLCLLYRGTSGEGFAHCTATCSSDSDCPDAMGACTQGFRCVTATITGPLACCKICVCNKDLPKDTSQDSVGQDCIQKGLVCTHED